MIIERLLARKNEPVPKLVYLINTKLKTTFRTVGITEMYLYTWIDFTPFANKNAYMIPLIPKTDNKTV